MIAYEFQTHYNSHMKLDVKHIAKLANLPLKDEEIPKFEKQLTDIVSYIQKLNELDTSDIEPTAQVTGLSNVTRNDQWTDDTLSQEEALSNVKEKHNGMVVVEQILEEK